MRFIIELRKGMFFKVLGREKKILETTVYLLYDRKIKKGVLLTSHYDFKYTVNTGPDLWKRTRGGKRN